MSIGAYGEMSRPAAEPGCPAASGRTDLTPIGLLLPTYLITPNIIFNAEIEFEPWRLRFRCRRQVAGQPEIEQIWSTSR